jgi:outer membrane murein-binding lipoprotein Lpp
VEGYFHYLDKEISMMRKIALVLLVVCIVFPSYAAGSKEAANAETKINDLTTKVDDQATKVDDLTTKVDGLTAKVDNQATKIDDLTTLIGDLSKTVVIQAKPAEDQIGQSSSAVAQFSPSPDAEEPSPQVAQPRKGIYVGILAFAGDIKNITPEFVFLDSSGKQQLLDYIDSYSPLPTPGSAYFYAVHHALTEVETQKQNLKSTENIKSAVIAITDGLDTASTNPALPLTDLLFSSELGQPYRNNLAQYYFYVTQLLEEKQINMSSIPITGADTLLPVSQNLSLDNKNVNESIAEIVKNIKASRPIAFTVSSAVYPNGTLIRIVLDGQMAANSKRYIEGRVSAKDGYALTDVTAKGIRLTETPIQVEKKDWEVRYTITVDGAVNKSLVQQWYTQSPSFGRNPNWIRNSEFGEITIVDVVVDSAVIYLVLDGSVSLERNIDDVQSRAKSVINLLYNAVSNSSSNLLR